MSVLPQSGTVLGTSTMAAPVLASTGIPAEFSIAVGVAIFLVLFAFFTLSKHRNKIRTKTSDKVKK